MPAVLDFPLFGFDYIFGFEFTSPGDSIHLGPLTLRWYGLLIAVAVFVGLQLSQKLARLRQINPEVMADLVIWLVLAAIPAARLYYVTFRWNQTFRLPNDQVCSYAQCPEEIVKIWHGGIAIHGAILGGILATVVFARAKQISFWRLADLVAPSVVLGQAIGRWGNFFNSEAHGAPTNLPWKLYIPRYIKEGKELVPQPPIPSDFVHPTFLYESLWNLGVLGLLLFLFFKYPKLKSGALFLTYAVAYSAGRFWIEGLRTDSLMFGPLRAAQIVSLTGIVLGGLGLWWLCLRKRPLPDVLHPTSTP